MLSFLDSGMLLEGFERHKASAALLVSFGGGSSADGGLQDGKMLLTVYLIEP
jgi:hypothetical protein